MKRHILIIFGLLFRSYPWKARIRLVKEEKGSSGDSEGIGVFARAM